MSTGTIEHAGQRSGHRSVQRSGHGPAEPLAWLVSAVSRGWRWVWSVDHDDAVSTTVAWLLQFGLLMAMFLAMVIGSR